MIRKVLFVLFAAFLAPHAYAQQVAVEPLPVSVEGPKLTAALQEQERGGTARVAFTVTASGTTEDVELQSSSGFPAFDELAVEAVKDWKFRPARDAAGAEVEVRRMAPIGFQTQAEFQAGVSAHLSDRLSQTCGQFLSEVEAAKPSTPDELPKSTKSFKELWTSAFAALLVSGDKPGVLIAMVEAERAVFEEIVSSCSASPDANFGDAFKASVQQQLSRARAES